jgi:hypothetical protein
MAGLFPRTAAYFARFALRRYRTPLPFVGRQRPRQEECGLTVSLDSRQPNTAIRLPRLGGPRRGSLPAYTLTKGQWSDEKNGVACRGQIMEVLASSCFDWGNAMSIETYLKGLSVAAPTARFGAETGPKIVRKGGTRVTRKGATAERAKPAALPEKLDAAVNAGSILSFVAEVEANERKDILYTVQLAQRVADKACDRFAETKTWYGKYNEVLEAVGWATEQYAFTAHKQEEGNLRMDKAALQIITAIAAGNQLGAITASISALEKLAADDNAITLFDHYASGDLSGNFQIGAVQKSNGILSMALGAFYFRTAARRKKFLFFTWGENEVNFWTAAQKMTFNTGIYSRVRGDVEKKLGARAVEYIAAIDI